MDASEAIVEKLLKHMGFESVCYEPDGNVPPDFLADGRVAVEVRRLNQNYDAGNGKRGLENTAIPLSDRVEKLASSFGPAEDESWFLVFHFSRPIKPWGELKPKLRAKLAAFRARPERSSGPVYADENFELDVIRASQPLEHYFCMGWCSDRQSGGFIVSEMLENIAHCSDEKLNKIASFRNKYPEWWLVLTDYIGYGLDDYNKQQLLAHAKRPAGWDKIVVVSPSNPKKWLEF